MDLKDLVKKIQETRLVAHRDIESLPLATRSGMIGAVNAAKSELKDLEAEYSRALFKNAKGIFVDGDPDNAKAFAQIPDKEGESLTADAMEMYRRLADVIEPSLVNEKRQFKISHTLLLTSALRDVAVEIGVASMPSLNLVDYPILPDYNALVDFVQKNVSKLIGVDLNYIYVAKQLTTAAVDRLYCHPTANILVLNAGPEESDSLTRLFLKGTSRVTVEASDKVNVEYVKNKLNPSTTQSTDTQSNKNKKK